MHCAWALKKKSCCCCCCCVGFSFQFPFVPNAFLIEFRQISRVKITLLIFSLSLSRCVCVCAFLLLMLLLLLLLRVSWQVASRARSVRAGVDAGTESCCHCCCLGHARETHPVSWRRVARKLPHTERESAGESVRASEASAQRAWKQKANIKQMFFKARPGGSSGRFVAGKSATMNS